MNKQIKSNSWKKTSYNKVFPFIINLPRSVRARTPARARAPARRAPEAARSRFQSVTVPLGPRPPTLGGAQRGWARPLVAVQWPIPFSFRTFLAIGRRSAVAAGRVFGTFISPGRRNSNSNRNRNENESRGKMK